MRIEALEKLVLGLSGVTVVGVGALVTGLSIMPLRSGIPQVAVDSSLATQDWLLRLRQGAGKIATQQGYVKFDTPLPAQPGQPAPAPTAPGQPAAPQPAPAGPVTTYFDAGGNIPVGEQVPGFPWLRRVQGVEYVPPQQVPQILYNRYQSFEETWTLVQEGGGEFTQTDKGETAYQVNWLDNNSYLATRLGLKKGDQIISVNGKPIGTSLTAGRGLYDQLKGERRFAVLVLRDKQPVVLSFYVQ